MARLELGGVVLDVVRKDVRNVHLSVHPPTGAVRIAAPSRMKLETIRLFAISSCLCGMRRGMTKGTGPLNGAMRPSWEPGNDEES